MFPPNKKRKKPDLSNTDPKAGLRDRADFVKSVNFEKDYIKTAKFKERVEKAGYDFEDYKENQIDILNSIKLRTDDDVNKPIAYYRNSENDVNLRSAKANKSIDNKVIPTGLSIISHEVGHSFNNENLYPFINKRNIYQPKTLKDRQALRLKRKANPNFYKDTIEGHELEPFEVVADVHAARRELYDFTKGKFDGRSSNLTEEAYKALKKVADINPDSASRRLLDKIKSKETEAELKSIPDPAKVVTEEQQLNYEKINDKIHKRIRKDNKQYIFDIMNRVVDNRTKTIGDKNIIYAETGGTLSTRPSSRQRGIFPIIMAGLAVASAVASTASSAAASKKGRRNAQLLEYQGLKNQEAEQALADSNALKQIDEYGNKDVQYYANGGEIQNPDDSFSPEQLAMIKNSLTKSPSELAPQPSYATQGGRLNPIGSGVVEVQGNKHNETTIDGVSGVQLIENGEVTAEVEDKEIIADGDKVYSQRLKYDKKHSYADKMRILTKKRNKLEQEQENTNDKRVKNTIERKLAGLNMGEKALFAHQEANAYKEGIQTVNKFAFGGKIRKLTIGGNVDPKPIKSWMRTFYTNQKGGKYNGYATNSLGEFRDPNNSNITIDSKGVPTYPYEQESLVNKPIPYKAKQLVTPLAPVVKDNTLSNILGAASAVAGAIGSTSGTTASKPASTTPPTTSNTSTANSTTPPVSTIPNSTSSTSTTNTNKSINWNNIGTAVGRIAPSLIDNVGNAILTNNTPAIPIPLLNRAQSLETKVNVNPQLADARRRRRTVAEGILRNTSNSNNAKNNMIASNIATSRGVDEILGSKENQELMLRNADAQNKQMVAGSNSATMNEYAFRNLQRSNDIQARKSANLSNLAGDIKGVIQMGQLDNQFNTSTAANLMDDKNGEKAVIYAQNEEFMNNPQMSSIIYNKAKTKDLQGNYMFPQLVELLKNKYGWTE